jgi:hypothetical protein
MADGGRGLCSAGNACPRTARVVAFVYNSPLCQHRRMFRARYPRRHLIFDTSPSQVLSRSRNHLANLNSSVSQGKDMKRLWCIRDAVQKDSVGAPNILKISYEHVTELIAERGVEVGASCIWRWVQVYGTGVPR